VELIGSLDALIGLFKKDLKTREEDVLPIVEQSFGYFANLLWKGRLSSK
jgi:hypothetical protein